MRAGELRAFHAGYVKGRRWSGAVAGTPSPKYKGEL